jgi:hypothetical protein
MLQFCHAKLLVERVPVFIHLRFSRLRTKFVRLLLQQQRRRESTESDEASIMHVPMDACVESSLLM